MTTKQKIETAESIINNGFAGKVWCKTPDIEGSTVRIYGNGYIQMTDTGANINMVKRASFDAAKSACDAAGITATR